MQNSEHVITTVGTNVGTSYGVLSTAPALVAVAIALIAATSPRPIDAAKGAEESPQRRSEIGRDWPLLRGDSLGTGVAKSSLPENLELLWKFEVPKGSFTTTPIVVDGMVYIGDADGVVRAIGLADGKERWKFKSE
ncbi:MAG TPA: PQQ-binding-like beta-propeller repeat protein, partial [Pirellulales bacterium]|nr:PQQ-binding-like beta-propeller repeat protein [Pirellulales bacterium]